MPFHLLAEVSWRGIGRRRGGLESFPLPSFLPPLFPFLGRAKLRRQIASTEWGRLTPKGCRGGGGGDRRGKKKEGEPSLPPRASLSGLLLPFSLFVEVVLAGEMGLLSSLRSLLLLRSKPRRSSESVSDPVHPCSTFLVKASQ